MKKEYLNKIYFEGETIFVGSDGQFGWRSPGKGMTHFNLDTRSFAIRLEDLDPDNLDHVFEQLQSYFQKQNSSENLDAYVDKFYDRFKMFMDSLKLQVGLKLCYKQLSVSKSISYKAYMNQVSDAAMPLPISPIISRETRVQIDHCLGKDNHLFSKYQNIIRAKLLGRLKAIFGESVVEISELENLGAQVASSDKIAAKKTIHHVHLACLENNIRGARQLVDEVNRFVDGYEPSVETQEIKSKAINTISELMQEKSTRDIFLLVLSDHDARVVIANGMDISSQIRTFDFIQEAQAIYASSEKTIYLPQSTHIFPFQDCGFVDIDRVYSDNLVCQKLTFFDEFMHAAMHIAFEQNDFSPHQNEDQRNTYKKAIDNDRKVLDGLMKMVKKRQQGKKLSKKEKKCWAALNNEILEQLKGKKNSVRLEVNNYPEVVSGIPPEAIGREIEFQRLPEGDVKAKILDIVPKNPWGDKAVVMELPPKQIANHEEMMENLVFEAVSNAEEALHPNPVYKSRGTDEKEILNRLLVFKWSENVTKLLMPNLLEYYQETVLPICREKRIDGKQLDLEDECRDGLSMQEDPNDLLGYGAHFISKALTQFDLGARQLLCDVSKNVSSYLFPAYQLHALTQQDMVELSRFQKDLNHLQNNFKQQKQSKAANHYSMNRCFEETEDDLVETQTQIVAVKKTGQVSDNELRKIKEHIDSAKESIRSISKFNKEFSAEERRMIRRNQTLSLGGASGFFTTPQQCSPSIFVIDDSLGSNVCALGTLISISQVSAGLNIIPSAIL